MVVERERENYQNPGDWSKLYSGRKSRKRQISLPSPVNYELLR